MREYYSASPTQSVEADLPPDTAAVPERYQLPPVDFIAIARNAVDGGLFAPDQAAIASNASQERLSALVPERLLQQPEYGNGPATIQLRRKDVPVAVMNQFRKNTAAANRLLLPQKEVLSFFHATFTGNDPFGAEELQQAAHDCDLPIVPFSPDVDPKLSFSTADPRRKTYDRKLFTAQEQYAGLELVRDRPDIALPVLAYQATIQRFLARTGTALEQLSREDPALGITPRDLTEYDAYAKLWESDNFTVNLIPALGVFWERTTAQTGAQSPVTAELYAQAARFVVDNGVFRHWVQVPAEVAADGKERTNKFLCAAANTINAQLLDGTLLHTIYRVADVRLQAGDQAPEQLGAVLSTRAGVRIARTLGSSESQAHYEREDRLPVLSIEVGDDELPAVAGRAIAKALSWNKPTTFALEDAEYLFSGAAGDGLYVPEEPQPDDQMLETYAGDNLYTVVGNGVALALQHRRAVHFDFNGTIYRISPERADQVVAAARQR